MKATTNIHKAETITSTATRFDDHDQANTAQATETQAGAAAQGRTRGKPESELRAAARRHGLNLKELADRMGVNYGYLSSVASGRRPWSPMLRERAMTVLGEVPGQGVVYRQGGLVKGESTYIRERARALGMSLKGLAGHVGVSSGYMTQVSRGQRNMSPAVQARVEAVLEGPARVEPAERANRPGGLVQGESCYIRERARELGMSLKELAKLAGVNCGYLSDVARGRKCMSPKVQARVEALLEGPARVESAPIPSVDCRALWNRMDSHGYSQNETARLAGISSGHLSQIMNGQRNPSGEVLRKLHGVLFQPSAAELVVPAEVKVMAWKKGGRNGVVVRGAGGPGAGNKPGGGTVRIGGRVPWGAKVEYAYRAGYDSRGQVSVTHVVDERGYGAMLTKPKADGAGPGEDRTGV